jgi:hypothetical protein
VSWTSDMHSGMFDTAVIQRYQWHRCDLHSGVYDIE